MGTCSERPKMKCKNPDNTIKSYFQDVGPILLNGVVGVVAGQSLSKSASDLNLKKHPIEPRPEVIGDPVFEGSGVAIGKKPGF